MTEYQVVNSQGQVVRRWDPDEDRAREESVRRQREDEPFTATVDCPWCRHVAVHWVELPRFQPEAETPVERETRMVGEMLSALTVSAPPQRLWDPPGTVVARVCIKCGYRWGQR